VDPGVRPLRADAARNRAGILRAAAAVFAARGCDVDVREIARCAGVGMGTLYRHFPTKEDLLDTVLREDFLAWTREARRAAQDREPWDALCSFMEDAIARQARQRAMFERFAHSWGASTVHDCRREVHPVIEELLAACHTAGVLRRGVGPDDISLQLIGLGRIAELTEPTTPGAWRRHLHIALDGLRAGHDRLNQEAQG
jgi:AcrR family transcriptional regulator